MFAAFTIVTGPGQSAPAVPVAAIVYEGARAHVWIARPDGAIEARDVKLGLITGGLAQVTEGVSAGEAIVTRGAVFMDRATSGDKAS
jgi:cobalt-zinc-cadmium efflux system membrane fusion protein